MKMNCLLCKKKLTDHQTHELTRRGKTVGYCSRKCFSKSLIRLESKLCQVCGSEFSSQPNRVRKMKVCSLKCNGVLTGIRTVLNPPMAKESARKKLSDTLRSIGCKPKIRGGNGTGPTVTENIIYKKLKKYGFYLNYILSTGGSTTKYGKLPNHYKIDVANPEKLIAIEIDGHSHRALKRKYQDLKKTDFLCSKKWKVLRFTNQQILINLNGCLSQIKSLI